MASFKEMLFTPAEFANIAKIDKSTVSLLESKGLLKTLKKRIGNVDRKMVSLGEMQNYFHLLRAGRHGDRTQPTESEVMGVGAEAAGPQLPASADPQTVAAATGFAPVDPKFPVQMFYNVKGGTGKSTLTAQYVMRAAMYGLNVLALDLDGQGHLTVNLDILDSHERPSIYDVLINDLPLEQAIMNVAPGLDLVPANLGLCNIEIPLNSKTRREYRLNEAIETIKDRYDIIVADTNPAASILNMSMLVAADLVNIVCATNPLSFHGMSLVMATIEDMEREFRKKLETRIVPNMYDSREVISQEVLGELKAQFVEQCARTVINRSADLNEATKRRTTVWDVNPKGTAAQDIGALADELLFG